MAKEILLYNPIYSSTAANFIQQLDANQGQNICARVYCNGGDVYATYGMIAKWNEHQGGKSMKVDGRADSSAAYMLCNSDNNECLTVSKFVFHRAAAPSWVESNKNLFTDDLKNQLTTVNNELRQLIERNTTAEKWQKVTGVSLDDMFSLDSRIDVEIDAQQAKKLGIIQNIIPLTTAKQTEINALCATSGLAAAYKIEDDKPTIDNKKSDKNMTAAEFKAANPAAYAEIVKEATDQERDRVNAYLQFADVDLEAVKKGITEGKNPSLTFTAEMTRKAMSKDGLANVEAANANATPKPDADTAKTEEQKQLEAYEKNVEKQVLAKMGIQVTA